MTAMRAATILVMVKIQIRELVLVHFLDISSFCVNWIIVPGGGVWLQNIVNKWVTCKILITSGIACQEGLKSEAIL
jgi:hypothetical protein